jgi:hypothetical protein
MERKTDEGSTPMSDTQIPSDQHAEFDAMCSEVEDFETLPTVKPNPVAPAPEELNDEERAAPLDEAILGGLVSP